MANTPNNIFDLSQETALSLSSGSWPQFLRTAAWNYKYDFVSQVLIYAQRPEATACASFDIWNDKFQRVPRKGTGIALLSDEGNNFKIKYVFDISDTVVNQNISSPSVPLWDSNEQKEPAIRQALTEIYLGPEEQHLLAASPNDFYNAIARHILEQEHESVSEAFSIAFDNSKLKDYPIDVADRIFNEILTSSVSMLLQHRSGCEIGETPEIFNMLSAFDSIEAISALGITQQLLGRTALLEMAHIVKTWDNKHKEAQKNENQLSSGRRTSNSEPDRSGAAGMEQVRTSPQDISEGEETDLLHNLASQGTIEQSLDGNRDIGSTANRSSDETISREYEETRSFGYYSEHSVSEQPSETSGRTDTSGDDLRINEQDGFNTRQTLGEQLKKLFEEEYPDELESLNRQIHTYVYENSNVAREALFIRLQEHLSAHPEVSENYRVLSESLFEHTDDPLTLPSATDAGFEVSFPIEEPQKPSAPEYRPSETLPITSDELTVGLTLNLPNASYLVTAISDTHVVLEDVNTPLFSQSMSKEALDIILRNAHQNIQNVSELNKEEPSKSKNTEIFAQDDIDNILRLASNSDHTRMVVTSAFQKQKSVDEIVELLKKEYHGGAGLKSQNGEFSVWYADDGIHLAKGQTARYSETAQIISWETASERIGQLLDEGKFASNMELNGAEGHEITDVASRLLYMYRDIEKDLRDGGMLASVEKNYSGSFPDGVANLQEALKDSAFREQLSAEYLVFLEAYEQNKNVLRFNYYKPHELLKDLQDLSLPRHEYTSEIEEVQKVDMFITEDEIDAALNRGSNVEGGKGRIYGYLTGTHNSNEKINFLKNEYGLGGSSHAVSGQGFIDYSGTGIKLRKGNCADVNLNWNKVLVRFENIIKNDRYFTSEEKAKYEEKQSREERLTALMNTYNEVKHEHPDDIVLFQVGDFFEMYGEDAKTASELLDLKLTTRAVPGAGRVEMCGIPSHILEQSVEKIRESHNVTISEVDINTEERKTYSKLSVNQEEFSQEPPASVTPSEIDDEGREDQKLLSDLLNHISTWRESDGVFVTGRYYDRVMDRISDIQISENESENKSNILQAAGIIYRFFPRPDTNVARAPVTSRVLNQADRYLDSPVDLKDALQSLRIQEWKDGAEKALWWDLRELSDNYRDRIPANLSEHVQYNADPYDAIPAITLFLESHLSDGVLDTAYGSDYRHILEAANQYSKDRTALYPGRGQTHTEASEHLSEPYIDHPELIQRDLSRDARRDKVVLADLLSHYITYRYTYDANTPSLNDKDSLRREEQMARIDEIVVSPSVGENLNNLRQVSEVLQRWFLPFEGIRSEIIEEQERLLAAAEEVLNNPPLEEQAEQSVHKDEDNYDYMHNYEEGYTYREISDDEIEKIKAEEEGSLWDFELPEEKVEKFEQTSSVQAEPLIDQSVRQNFRTTDLTPHYGGPKERFRGNIAAISLLKQLEKEERLATKEEQQILSRYVGWGGLSKAFDENASDWSSEYSELKNLLTDDEYISARASTQTAFYTPPVVIEAIYKGLEQLGIKEGNILDAGCGTGAFFGQAPDGAKLYGIELDSISGRIARQLYQQANIAIEGFENTKLPDNFFTGMVGNVPFGNFGVFDPKYNKYNFQIHDYFFAKGLDKIRPGGVMALVTSTGTMDKENEKFRRYLAERADLIGAIRLPNNTFKENAGTDVTSDILFLRKRSQPRIDVPEWVETRPISSENVIGKYFIDHYDMILGNLKEVSGPFGPQITCVPKEGVDLRSQLQEAISHIIDEAEPLLDEIDDPSEDVRISIPADEAVANFSFTVVNNDVYFREDDRMFRVDANQTQLDRVRGMVEIRDTVHELINAQLENHSDTEILRLQNILNEQYDEFAKDYGLINSRANSIAFSNDSSYFLLCSLEQLDEKDNFIGKADIFTKRTISARKEISHVDTPYEALLVSLGERGRVDLDYMEHLCDIEKAELLSELEGQIFEDPKQPGTYLIAALYLSGNILEKIEEAQEAEKELPGHFSANIKALESAMPEPLGPEDISVRLGAYWVPPDIIRDFMYETFKTNWYNRTRRLVDVDYSPVLDQWAIKGKGNERFSVQASTQYGTSRMDAYTILEQTLNQKTVCAYKTDPITEKRVIDQQETIVLQEKQELIRNEFIEWLWRDPERAARICDIYNRKFNCFCPPKFDGDVLTFHGISPFQELRKNQRDAVARILFNGNTLLAAEVGAGKTWMMTAAAMEGKYLGLCSKSMIAVPNHLVGQWTKDIYKLYPSAKVLSVTKKDFEPKNRKKFCSRIATGDYDIVVIGHSQLEKIPLSTERQKSYLQAQLDEVLDYIQEVKSDKDKPFTVKQMEAKRRSLEVQLKKLTESKKKDDVITFEQLGVDRLFVDESDEFKNLYLFTKMQNVAGLAQTDSQKAADLFLKCRYMDELTGCKGNIHATGTPLSNTMAEIYTEGRYLQYDMLKKMGLHNFDAWLSNFGEAKQVLELAPEGTGFRMRNRLTNFYNLPELMALYRQVTEIQTKEMLNLPLPTVHYVTKSLPPSEEQKQYVQELAERAEKIRNGSIDRSVDNMLCVVNDGRKVALDQRLINPELPDDPYSKVNATADTVYEEWVAGKDKKLTQLVFCDMSTPKTDEFNVYDALRDKLVEKGIPKEEICFIHDANTDAQKDALFAKVRSGEVRVLMGSTNKMGTGTNVQNLLIAGHDMDCPWRPRDLTQRNGRVIRFGNTNDDVYIYRYVTEGTFDAYMYQLLESKQRLISQIFTGNSPARQIEDLDQATLSFAEIKGIASGNPLIKEKVELQMDISKLETIRARHIRNQINISNMVKQGIPAEINNARKLLERYEKDKAIVETLPSRTDEGKYFPITVGDKCYFESATDSAAALLKSLEKLPSDDAYHNIGSYRGFTLVGSKDKTWDHDTHLYLQGTAKYEVPVSGKALGLLQSLNRIADNIPEHVTNTIERIEVLENKLNGYKEELGKPFSHEAELREKQERMKELDKRLNMDLQQDTDLTIESEENPENTNSLINKIRNAEERAGGVASQNLNQIYNPQQTTVR